MRNQLRDLATNDANPTLRLVIAANRPLTKLFRDSGQDSPFEGICIEVELLPWQEDMMKEFISSRLAQTSVDFSEEDLQSLCQESQGNPRRLMQLCNQMYRQHLQ